MKLFIKLSAILLLLVLPAMSIKAKNGYSSIPPEEVICEVTEEPSVPVPPRRERIPAAPILCSISYGDGVHIAGIDTACIQSFEIYETNGNPLAVVADELSFIEILFSMNGEVRVVFRLSDRILTGWVKIQSGSSHS